MIEGLFSLLIFIMVLAALAQSLANLSRAAQARDKLGVEFELAQVASLVREDLQGAQSQTNTANSLTLVRQNPELPLEERVSRGLNNSTSSIQVTYLVREGWLRRIRVAEGRTLDSPLLEVTALRIEEELGVVSVTLDYELTQASGSFEIKVDTP